MVQPRLSDELTPAGRVISQLVEAYEVVLAKSLCAQKLVERPFEDFREPVKSGKDDCLCGERDAMRELCDVVWPHGR